MTEPFGGIITVDTSSADKILALAEGALSFKRLGIVLETLVVDYFQQRTERRFAMGGDNASGGWDDLHPATVLIREAEGFDAGPINVRSGELKRSVMTSPGEVEATDIQAELRWPTSDVTSQPKYMGAQQGVPFNPNPLYGPTVPRPVVAIDETDAVMVMGILENELKVMLAVGGEV